MDKHARTRAADLALVEQDAELQAIHGHIPLAIREVDVCRLAAQLQRAGDQAVGRSQRHIAADLRGAGKGQLAEALVLQNILTGLGAGAGDDIEYARRQNILNESRQLQHGQRRVAGRLKDGAAAGSQHGGQLPGGHQEGEIPRHNLAHNADRLTQDQRQKLLIEHICTALVGQNTAGKIAEMLRRQRHINRHGLTDGFAVIQRLHHGQMLRVGIDDVRDFI